MKEKYKDLSKQTWERGKIAWTIRGSFLKEITLKLKPEND